MRGVRVIVAPVVLLFHLEATRISRKRDLSRLVCLRMSRAGPAWHWQHLGGGGGSGEGRGQGMLHVRAGAMKDVLKNYGGGRQIRV